MTSPNYTYSQSGRLYFRRRIPGFSTIRSPLMVSLGTMDPNFAPILSERLTKEFDDMLDAFLFLIDEIPEDLMSKYMAVRLKHAVSDIRRQNRMERMTGRTGRLAGQNLDLTIAALEALLEDGIQKDLPVAKISPSWSPSDLETVMEIYQTEIRTLTSTGLKTKLEQEFFEATSVRTRSWEHQTQLQEVYLQARLAAMGSLKGQKTSRTAAFKQMAVQLTEKSPVSFPPVVSSNDRPTPPGPQVPCPDDPTTVQRTPGVELIKGPLTLERISAQFAAAATCGEEIRRNAKVEPFGQDLAGVCERSVKFAGAKIDNKTAEARRARVKLFSLLTGVQTITELEQYHLWKFEEQLDDLPRNFNRSIHDQKLTLEQIQDRASKLSDDEVGRAPKTFNDYLETMSALVNHARTIEKHVLPDPEFDATSLRRPYTKRGRKKRSAFKPCETKALFQHPVWHGCRSRDRRQEQGDVIHKDGLFFVPLIVAYTGSRMEEISGLPADAIVKTKDGYGFDIRPHDERRLKNLQSERLIPVHEHLIELGILEHQARMRERKQKFLFPEQFPTSEKKKFTSALRYNWRLIREVQLDGNPRGLDGHSLRHAFNQFLKNQRSVSKDVRLDLLGHAGEDLNEEVYGDEDGMPFHMKKEAIDLLPRVF